MMIRLLICLLLPISALGQNILLSGFVTDGKTKKPVEDAIVRLYLGGALGELKSTTDEKGFYEIASKGNPYNKDYAFTIQKEGYQRVNGVIRLNFGKEPYRNYKLYTTDRRLVVPERKEEVVEQVQEDAPSLMGAPANNLIFLIDVSGSMGEENRLENMKGSLKHLVSLFRPEDKVSIIAYSSYPKVLLEQGSTADQEGIEEIIDKLRAGGQSKGTEGLRKAYDMAMVNYTNGGNNKIILATDGFFAMDKKSQNTIETLIRNGLGQGVKLSIFAFGKKDQATEDRLTRWCKTGNGFYTNITSLERAKSQVVIEAKGY